MVDQTSVSRAAEAPLEVLGEKAVAVVRGWVDRAAETAQSPVGRTLSDAELAVAAAAIDGVARPDDNAVALRNLERLAALEPELVSARLRSAIRLGGTVGEALPWAVAPTSRRILRRMIGHLIADATPSRLGETIARVAADGSGVTLELLAHPARDEATAALSRAGLRALLARDDVDAVLLRVPLLVADAPLWEFDAAVARVAETLLPLYEAALARDGSAGAGASAAVSGTAVETSHTATETSGGARPAASGTRGVLLMLEADQYRYADLTIAVFQRLLSRPEFAQLEAGITLQADLPGALATLQGLQSWAAGRVAAGGAPLTVRLVRSGDRVAERLDALQHGWPLATFADPRETARNLARLLEWALTPERTDAVRLILAGDDLFAIAFAWVLAGQRDCADRIVFELGPDLPAGQADAVRLSVGGTQVQQRVVAVRPSELAVASPYLLRLLDEKVAGSFEVQSARFQESLSGLSPTWPERQEFDVMDSILDSDEAVQDARLPASRRSQNRTLLSRLVAPDPGSFENAPVTDPSVPTNREWARRILERAAHSRLGLDTLSAARQRDALLAGAAAAAATVGAGDGVGGALSALVGATAEAGGRWGAEPVVERAAQLRRAALALEANRDCLIEVLVSEAGATFDAADAQASAAVDFASYYAGLALELEHVDGARHVPPALVVVIPSAEASLATPADGVLRALAAGAAVILTTAHRARRASAVLVEALWESGVPRDALVLVDLDDVPDAPPGAAPDVPSDAAPDGAPVGAAGDAPGGALRHLVADSRVDHVLFSGPRETAEQFRSWRTDLPLAAEFADRGYSTVVTPNADFDLAAADIAMSGLGLEAGSGTSPGTDRGPALLILVGSVAKSAAFTQRLAEASATNPRDTATTPRDTTNPTNPTPRITHAATLDDAIALQNAAPFAAAALQSLDPAEVAHWLARSDAADLFVNRGITGPVAGRRPAGGGSRSSAGHIAKAGGPNALMHLGRWQAEQGPGSPDLGLAGLDARVRELIDSATAGLDWSQFDLVRRGAFSDDEAWRTVFAPRELTADHPERTVLRHRAVPVVIRLSEGEPFEHLVRILAAGTRVGASLGVSSALKLPRPLRALLKERRVRVFIENDAEWLARAVNVGEGPSRIRMLGGDPLALAEAVGASLDVAIFAGDVTPAGRLELLPFLTEQTVTLTNHRFGGLSPLNDVRIN